MSGSGAGPRVSVGLPVYNGENYVAEAIESILGQSHRDLELVISDNASDDRTEEICRSFAARDPRVRYVRSPRNLGAAANYGRVLELASGGYFKWAAHDDVCDPRFIEACLAPLERDPSLVLAYPLTGTIDYKGRRLKDWPPRPALAAPEPRVRLREALLPMETHPIWGLIRSDVLRRTPGLGSFPGHDLPLLAELALHGRFHEVPRTLFFQREHRGRSVRVYDFSDPHGAIAWYDPSRAGRMIFPRWRLLREYLAAIGRAPLRSGERLRCLVELAPWVRRSAAGLVDDLVKALGRLPGVGPPLVAASGRLSRSLESLRWRRVARSVRSVTRAEDLVLLVDTCWVGREHYLARRSLPFLERDGQFFGVPADDAAAIRELERMRAGGARFIVFAWPTYWWLEYYGGLAAHLRKTCRPALEDRHVAVFELDAAAGPRGG